MYDRGAVRSRFPVLWVLLMLPVAVASRADDGTDRLAKLLGVWEIERTYVAQPERPPMTGTLNCAPALREAYIRCRYELGDGRRTLEETVYFNHNPIYGRYESLWLSATWPIKVVMAGQITDGERADIFRASSDFPIESGVTEYVRSEHRLEDESFQYRVSIRTSEDPDGHWQEHMAETARRAH